MHAGFAFFALGLAKKTLLANPCGKIADAAFGASWIRSIDAWFGAVAYAFQIYFGFSDYSDMAIGLGLMLGFIFAKNFDSPYRAESITDFWRRWHISLSTWLREYLYIPLGGNRLGKVRTYLNLMATMLLGGLWHGASWNFVIWGGLHGGMLAFERSQGRESGLWHSLSTLLSALNQRRCVSGLGGRSDLGLDATSDLTQSSSLLCACLASVERSRDTGV